MSTFYSPPPQVIDGDTAEAIDVNGINNETASAFDAVEAALNALNFSVQAWADLAERWSNEAEDVEVEPGLYSAFHWSQKSAASASAAAASEAQAITSQNAAAASATSASNSATAAAASASSASTSATNAANSASSASGYASSAAGSALSAANSVITIATYRSQAQTAATQANTSASIASNAATSASTSATNAATSESNAAGSANSASISATNAATSEDNAELYSINAAASATDAATEATDAATSADEAAASAAIASAIVTNVSTGLPLAKPSLLLNFAATKSLDPRITFSRASRASYVNEKGLIDYAEINEPVLAHDPVTGECKGLAVWEARTNLIKYTEDFGDATWANKSRCYVASNIEIAPDGTMTADKVANDAIGITDWNISQLFTYEVGKTYCLSYFFKPTSGSTTYPAVYLHNSAFGVNQIVAYDKPNDAAANIGGTPVAWGLEKYPNGWRRMWIAATATTTVLTSFGALFWARIGIFNGTTYTTDAAGEGYYLWGAQLEEGSFPTPYIPSTETFVSRASTATYLDSDGLIKTAAVDESRLIYNISSLDIAPELLLEGSSTNLLNHSESFDNAYWSKTNTTVTPDAIVAPDGTSTADKVVENSSLSSHTVSTTLAASGSTTYTYSIFLKAGERTRARVVQEIYSSQIEPNPIEIDLAAGSIVSASRPSNAKIEAIGNGWYRVSATSTTIPAGGSIRLVVYLQDSSGNVTYQGNGTSGFYVWGAQFEVSPSRTSYIPTTTTTVTRAADVSSSATSTRSADIASMTGSNFSDWYRQDEGSVCVSYAPNQEGSKSGRIFAFSKDDILIDSIFITRNSSGLGNNAQVFYGGSLTGNISIAAVGPSIAAISYKANHFAFSVNGSAAIVDDPAKIPTVDRLTLGRTVNTGNVLNGHIAHLVYYPKALSDAELQIITQQ